MIIKYDMVGTYLKKFDKANKHSISHEELCGFAKRLREAHQPIEINYRKKFGLDKEQLCDECNVLIDDERVVQFCSKYPERFGDNVYCRTCQKKYNDKSR